MATTVKARVEADLREALRARDRPTVSTLRVALGALANAEALPLDQVGEEASGAFSTEAPRRHVSDDDARALLSAEAAELDTSAALLAEHGRPERAAELTTQAEVLRRYL
jgi:uncharacterized protein YqeY